MSKPVPMQAAWFRVNTRLTLKNLLNQAAQNPEVILDNPVNRVVSRATGRIIRRHMRTDRAIILVFASLLLPTGNSSANGKETTSPEALISRALLQQDVWTDGAKPVLMRAEIQVTNAKGTSVRGNYVLNWVSSSQWREEIRFADYDRLRVGNAKGYWQKS